MDGRLLAFQEALEKAMKPTNKDLVTIKATLVSMNQVLKDRLLFTEKQEAK